MKYCINYKKNFNYYDLADEIIFKYEKDFYPSLIEFLEENEIFRNKILIIDYSEIEESIDKVEDKLEDILSIIGSLRKKYSLEIKLKLNRIDLKADAINKIKDAEIPFFFHYFINTWDELHGLLKVGVSDVYITDDLGFELKDVSKLVHSYNAAVRVFPNVAQSSWENSEHLKKFFIRPEDVVLYEDYVDVCEFWNSYYTLNTIFKIYVIDKKWDDYLSLIINDFNSDLNNTHLISEFMRGRINCGKICVKGKHCSICDRSFDLAKKLEEEGYTIMVEENEKEIENL